MQQLVIFFSSNTNDASYGGGFRMYEISMYTISMKMYQGGTAWSEKLKPKWFQFLLYVKKIPHIQDTNVKAYECLMITFLI